MRWNKSGQMPPLHEEGEQTPVAQDIGGLPAPWVMLAAGLALQVLLWAYFRLALGGSPFDQASTAGLLLAVVLCVPLHEALHGAAHPGAGLSPYTVAGFLKSQGLPYCVYTKPHSRQRALWALVAPFALMSALPALLALGGWCPPELAVLAVLNAAGSGADLVMASRLWTTAPANATVGYDQGKLKILVPAPRGCPL